MKEESTGKLITDFIIENNMPEKLQIKPEDDMNDK